LIGDQATGSPFVDIDLAGLATAPTMILLDCTDPNLKQIHFVPRLVSGTS
jgi:hypothetical protein